MSKDYERSIEELEFKAVNWWPNKLTKLETSTSVIPLLLKTQKKFISILNLCAKSPENVFVLINNSDISANLFLKHLVVLSDFGGEKLQRLNKNFDQLFPLNAHGERVMNYYWQDQEKKYIFKKLPINTLSNNKLKIDGINIVNEYPVVDDLYKDVIMLLLFGSNVTDEVIAEEVLNKCEVGNLIGNSEELDKFINERYIFVSRITGGAQANTLGQVAQRYVLDFINLNTSDDYLVQSNGRIKGVTHNSGRTDTTFDIVVSRDGKFVAIEISFQVTTNSTIERKSGQAKARYDMVTSTGNYIAYVIDGAGNFQRRSAVSTICENSHCTVAYSDEELKVLTEFIKEKLS
ncbi:hypothetical protein GCM10010954_15800 [Halobacillus andaensis]|uniref:Type-2 restriction enzyme BanI n=1 Tax=Halobacillus andaensis TaxID=1176239 RepID=A0A917B4D1_HALAA|nr:restriction endonuclease [Halobacillus andaensis]MBP2004920.1 uncharacterized protein affecting Mg2+/Co2+ transport [Halobacillus andaensis]GGF17882.1 hypothetical protein GCM10010954_15800 [Halobacillus andaensis]